MDDIMQELYDFAKVNGLAWMVWDLNAIRERLEKYGETITIKDRILEDGK